MAALEAAIHDWAQDGWMAGSSPAMTWDFALALATPTL
jgi:hypothetical protein